MTNGKLILLRHGQSKWNESNQFTGWVDVDLTEKGEAEAKRGGELLRDDLEAKGPVRVSDVENAQKEILTIARRMAEAGEIVLGSKGGEEMI